MLKCISAKCLKLTSREEEGRTAVPLCYDSATSNAQLVDMPRIVEESFGSLSSGSRGRLEGREQY